VSARGPLDGIELVLIDGNNLLHRRAGSAGDAALRGLLPELRRALPANVHAQLILDGHPETGTQARQRVSPVLDIRYAGGSADDAIVAEISGLAWASRGHTIVVTDDHALADRSKTAGALHRRLDWLTSLPPAPTNAPQKPGTALGAGRPPRRARQRPTR
jgi:hypothetical protein